MEPLFAKKIHKLNSSEKILKKALEVVEDAEYELVELIEKKYYQQAKNLIWDTIYKNYVMMIEFVNSHYGTDEEIEDKDDVDWDELLFETKLTLKTKIDGAFMLGDEIAINRQLGLIMETECTSIFNKGMYNIMKRYCDSGIVCGGLEYNPCPKCIVYGGKHDIEWIGDNLPPYHPQCRCVIEYIPRKDVNDEEE